ncbi:MAG: hypothetical protein MUO76_21065 [Anaerolineaceae bacterium]|nr:hypothetical protein [Anaerolineaceae bacterium]
MRSRRFVRFIWFGISILVGIAAGLFIGWSLLPTEYANTSPDSLRSDYRVDYILMVAEIYAEEGDVGAAINWLDPLEGGHAVRMVQQAALDARDMGYDFSDLELIVHLAQALSIAVPSPTVESP